MHEWAKNHKAALFVPIDEEQQQHVATILARYERLVDTRKNRSAADPFVIALAMAKGCTVVTAEAATGKADRPNIRTFAQASAFGVWGSWSFSASSGGDSDGPAARPPHCATPQPKPKTPGQGGVTCYVKSASMKTRPGMDDDGGRARA